MRGTGDAAGATVGATISHYRVLDRLGAGGMGEVYLAEDLLLGRKVALKVIRPGAAGDERAERRFLLEAQAAAQFDHPGICAVHEVGRDGEKTFIAMQYVAGETLAQRLRQGPLAVPELVTLAVQLAEALAEAHSRGVVHRDLKPGNVMLTDKGGAKLLDFGLARVSVDEVLGLSHADTPSHLTTPGALVGTLFYMSPEQLRGRPATPASDVFALGMVLYEAATGSRAFDGGSGPEVLAAILHGDAAPLGERAGGVPADLERVVARALAREPRDRYPTAAELLADLRAVRRSLESGEPLPVSSGQGDLPLPSSRSLAVLPFLDRSVEQDQAYFCEGMAEEVTNALARVKGLRVAARSSAFSASRRTREPREIGRALGVGLVLDGTVRRAGTRLRVSAELVSAADGFHVWSDRYDRELADVFEVQDDIASAIAGALELRLSAAQRERGTSNVAAYQLYLKGLHQWNRRVPEAIRAAIGFFQQALAEDPAYAAAWAGMAACLIVPGYYGAAPPGQVMPRGREAARKALAIDDSLADAHAVLGMVAALHDHDWVEAERSLARALERNPASSTALMWRALFVRAPQGRLEEALADARRATEIDPLNASAGAVLGSVLYYDRRYDAAVAQMRATLDHEPDTPIAHYYMGKAHAARGDAEAAIAAFDAARRLLGDSPVAAGASAWFRATRGDKDEARRVLDQLQASAASRYVAAHPLAEIHLGLGDEDEAFRCLERALDERSALVAWLLTDPLYDPIRSDPRFAALVARLGVGALPR